MPKPSRDSRLERLEDASGLAHAELAEQTRAFAAKRQAERDAWAALSRAEKLERRRADLAQLDAGFAKAAPEEWCANLYDIEASRLELEILELAGAPAEYVENARDWSQRRTWAHKLGSLDETPEQARERYQVIREEALQARRDWQSRRWLIEDETMPAQTPRERAPLRIAPGTPERTPTPPSDPIAPFRGRDTSKLTEPDPPLWFEPGAY